MIDLESKGVRLSRYTKEDTYLKNKRDGEFYWTFGFLKDTLLHSVSETDLVRH